LQGDVIRRGQARDAGTMTKGAASPPARGRKGGLYLLLFESQGGYEKRIRERNPLSKAPPESINHHPSRLSRHIGDFVRQGKEYRLFL
jgi:hypothetical protein